MELSKLTPVCTVERVEDSLPFWVDRLGFQKVAEVEHGEALGFAMLVRDGVTVMLQSVASVAADVPEAAGGSPGSVMLYIDVPALGPVIEALDGCDVVVPLRETFYGTREIWFREPGGHIVGFSQQIDDAV